MWTLRAASENSSLVRSWPRNEVSQTLRGSALLRSERSGVPASMANSGAHRPQYDAAVSLTQGGVQAYRTHAETALITRHSEMGRCTPISRALATSQASLERSEGPMSKMALEVVFSGFELAKTRTGCANRNGVAKTLKATRTARGSISLMPTAEDAEEDPLLVAPEAHAAQDRRWERKYNSAALVFSL